MTKYYKCLTKERTGGFSGFVWPESGVKLDPVDGQLKMCRNGYHACTAEHLIEWFCGGPVAEFFPDGEILHGGTKICAEGGVLGKEFELTDEADLFFQADCAARVLHIFEDQCPNDTRVRDCINAKYALCDDAAKAVPRAAAWSAAREAWSAAASERKWQSRQLAYRLGIYKTPAPGYKKWKVY